MGWVFLILAVLFIGLAVGYYPLNFCRVFVDFCREAIANLFAFLADFFRLSNPLIPLIIATTVFLVISYFVFKKKTIQEPKTGIEVSLFDEKSSKPIDHARLEIGQYTAYSNSIGVAKIPVDNMVLQSTVVKITHPQYIARYLTKDNIMKTDTIHCRRKYRLIVVDWEHPKEMTSEQLIKSRLNLLRRNMEEQFAYCQEINLLAESLRDKIVEELYKIREDRALYDPETITEVGDFLGATHGVFCEIRLRNPEEFELKGYFVDLAKAKMLTSQSIVMSELNQLEGACTYLADLLISHFSEIRVLRPANGSQCGRVLSVDGYILFRPRHSHIWLSVLPEGQHLHYPQLPITVEKDGRWTASSVSIGDGRMKVPAVFYIKPILADPAVHSKIQEYLQIIGEDGRSPGIDVTGWERERRCRIYEGIRVVRVR